MNESDRSGSPFTFRWIAPGDGEGFVVAFVNNLVQLLILAPLCTNVLGFSPGLIYGRILPGVAVSFLVGNLFYAWQAFQAREARAPRRRLRAALRHQHAGIVRAHFPRHAAGEATRPRAGHPRPRTLRVARRAGGVLPRRLAGVRLRVLRRANPAAHPAGRDAGDPGGGRSGLPRPGLPVPDLRVARSRVLSRWCWCSSCSSGG